MLIYIVYFFNSSRQEREKFVIGTKVRFNTNSKHVNDNGLSRRCIVEACEASLRRLNTDYIDFYQVIIKYADSFTNNISYAYSTESPDMTYFSSDTWIQFATPFMC
jgi:diketogulonate reductase-like aldo/keto reductase